MGDAYAEFIARKAQAAAAVGFDPGETLHPAMFPHQRDVTRWALRRGRAAMFLDTGLGKTMCLLTWAERVRRHTGRPVLVVAPLAVSEQIAREAEHWGISGGTVCRSQTDAAGVSIAVTNYEMLHAFDPRAFSGIVLDESSRLKDETGTQRNALIAFASSIPYRLCCSATPAPNDHTELGSHSEFLGIKTRSEMLAEYFVHDGGKTQDWRIKGHAHRAFFAWLASWGAYVRKPSDLGHDDAGYDLPPLRMHEEPIYESDEEVRARGMLFADEARGIAEQRAVRRSTIGQRVARAAELASGDESVLVWCELNDEADACERAIPGAVQVSGADSLDEKRDKLLGFADGRYRVLVSKPKIAGAGLNFQRCARQVFVGASHSYEQTYQAIRRSWRFGQTRPVDVHIIRTESEGAVMRNYRAKQEAHERMAAEMVDHMRETMRAEILGARKEWRGYDAAQAMALPEWLR